MELIWILAREFRAASAAAAAGGLLSVMITSRQFWFSQGCFLLTMLCASGHFHTISHHFPFSWTRYMEGAIAKFQSQFSLTSDMKN